jgi:cytidine deaminase
MYSSEESVINAAREVRLAAYAPYSHFAVGAALLSPGGRLFTGCNIENISFGLTICAERVALGTAIAAGVTEFSLLAIVSDSGEPVVPCGACRQVLAEFAPNLRVVSSNLGGLTAEFGLDVLLPRPTQGILK